MSQLLKTIHRLPAPTPADAGEQEESVNPSRPGRERIQLHGHWVLSVKERNGILREHREFNQSLTPVRSLPFGDQLLAALLTTTPTYTPTLAFLPPKNTIRINTSPDDTPPANHRRFVCPTSLNPGENTTLSADFTIPVGLTTITSVQTLMPLSIDSATSFVAATNPSKSTDPSPALSGPQLIHIPLTSNDLPGDPLLVVATQIITVALTIKFH